MTNQKLEELKKKIVEAADPMDKERLALTENINLEDVLAAIGFMVESIPYTDELWNFFESFGMKVSIRNKKEWRFSFFGINQSALAFPNIVGKKVFEGGLVLKLLELYVLGQPLHLQSEETINFLHSILCKQI